MRGHEAIIAARRAGSRPSSIVLLTQPFPRGMPPTGVPGDWVFVEPTDAVAGLDLRFVVGCLVFVDGQDSTRVRALVDAAKRAGAGRVIGSVAKPVGESFEIVESIDTEGVISWT